MSRAERLYRRTSLTLPNGVLVEYAYDAASRLTSITYKQNGTTVLGDLTYEYDKNGNRTKIGGSFARTGIPQGISSTAYNVANQQTIFDNKTLTYDNNVNLQTITDPSGTTTYTWNARNQLVGISGPTVTASFVYDGLGRRQQKTVNGSSTEFLYDGVNPVQETSGAAVLANILPGLGIDEFLTRTDVVAGTTSNFLTDALGSPIAVTDTAGTVQTEYTYEPFGKTTVTGASNTNPYQYTGRENDGTGLYYYRARYYSPQLQRFISEDAIRSRSGSYNFYSYVENDPTNRTDPSGMFSVGNRDCTNTSDVCDDYPPCETYGGANARCFCKCAGNDPWSQTVRCCLRDLYEQNFSPNLAHGICWALATAYYQVPGRKLTECTIRCVNDQRQNKCCQ